MTQENNENWSTENEDINAGRTFHMGDADDIPHAQEEEEEPEWVEEVKGKINTEFPLSGGETEEDFQSSIDDDDSDDDDFIADENIDENFPLSGG